MYKNLIKVFAIAALISASQVASAAPTYKYERGAGTFGGANNVLAYDSITATYNTGTEAFSFEVDYNGAPAQGGWLVISEGDNPKNSTSELGIAYFDAASGNTWVYAYNGQNNSSSYLTMNFLGFFANSYTTVGDVATLSFDTSSFSPLLDTGFSFGTNIGIWFHPSASLFVAGNSNGLINFSATATGFFDVSYDANCSDPGMGCITTVPEPSTLLLLTLGAGLLFYARRRTPRVVQQGIGV